MDAQGLTNRTLNDADLEGCARRIAWNARAALEAANPWWAYLPSFNEAVIAEATQMLKTVVRHERQQADDFIDGCLV